MFIYVGRPASGMQSQAKVVVLLFVEILVYSFPSAWIKEGGDVSERSSRGGIQF